MMEASLLKAESEEVESQNEEKAPVGSISHIFKTVFRSLYEEEEKREIEGTPEEDASSCTLEKDAEDGELWLHRECVVQESESLTKIAKQRKLAIEKQLALEKDQAEKLLAYMQTQMAKAQTADADAERDLKKRGLLMNTHYPVGPSRLELKPEASIFTQNIITAAKLIEENRTAFLRYNGYLGRTSHPEPQVDEEKQPGYLKLTNADRVRRHLSLSRSHAPNGEKFRGSTTQSHAVQEARKLIDQSPSTTKNPQDQELEHKLLERIQRKNGYLKNPRYDNANPNNHRRLIAPLLPMQTERKDSLLLVEPISLTWKHFKMLPSENNNRQEDTLEQTLIIRNASAVSRRLRLIPPTTPAFRIVKFKWPATDGTLAPGMALKVVVRFLPKALITYQDTINVHAESGTIPVKLHAYCEPPSLTLAKSLDLGSCFLGLAQHLNCKIQNNGGPGRFRFVSELDQSSQNNDDDGPFVLDLPPNFALRPAIFALDRGESIDVEAIFEPCSAGITKESFYAIAENAPEPIAYAISGRGEVLDIHLDQSALAFNHVLLGASATQTVTVTNRGSLPVDCRWDLSIGSDFKVTPAHKTLTPSVVVTFEFEFEPSEARTSESKASLIILSVPAAAIGSSAKIIEENTQAGVDAEVASIELSGVGDRFQIETTPECIELTEPLILGGANALYDSIVTIHNPTNSIAVHWHWAPVQSSSEDIGKVSVSWEPSEGGLGPGESVKSLPTVLGQVVGNTRLEIPLIVSLSAGGTETVFEAARFQLRAGVSDGRFHFSQDRIDFGLMSVQTQASHSLQITNPTNSTLAWSFSVPDDNDDDEIELPAEEDCGPTQLLSETAGTMPSSLSVASITSTEDDTPEYRLLPLARVDVEPPCGLLQAKSTQSVILHCSAGTKPQDIQIAATCQPQSGEIRSAPQSIKIVGRIEAPQVSLVKSQVDFATVYNGICVERRISIVNRSTLSTKFDWKKKISNASYTIELEPNCGDLAGLETLEMRVLLTAHSSGLVDKTVACHITGISRPLKLQVKAISKGAVLAYELLDPSSKCPSPLAPPHAKQLPDGLDLPSCPPPPKLNFGKVPLFERKTLRFVVRNLSAIPAPFEFKAQKYLAVLPPKKERRKGHGPLLTDGSADEIQAFSSKNGRAYAEKKMREKEDREILCSKDRVAFSVAPESGLLDPWGVVVVSVTAYNNMIGTYHDNIESSVQGMPLVRFPISMGVIGCPLSLRPEGLVLTDQHNKDGLPLLDFGQMFIGKNAKALQRSIRVRNAGPVDAHLTWRIGPDGKPTNDRVVDVSLMHRTPADCDQPLAVTVRWHEEPEYIPPFKIEPTCLRVAAYCEAKVSVIMPAENVAPDTPLFATETPTQFRALISANAEWIRENTAAIPRDDAVLEESTPTSPSTEKKSVTLNRNKPVPGLRTVCKVAANLSTRQDGPNEANIDGAVKLRLKADLLTPKLAFEKEPDLDSRSNHTIRFRTSSSRAVQFAKMQKKSSLDSTLVQCTEIQNPSNIELQCSLKTDTPSFKLASIRSASQHLKKSECKKPFVLAPKESAIVELHFCPSLNGKDYENSDSSRLTFEYDGKLTSTFATGQEQIIQLHGDILRPLVIVSPPAYDFGVVRAKNSIELIAFISNPSEIAADWQLFHVPRSTKPNNGIDGDFAGDSVDEPDVFQWSEQSGTQCGPSMPLSTAAACLPKDFNRSEDALWPQTTTSLCWRDNGSSTIGALTTLEKSLRAQGHQNPRLPVPIRVNFAPTRDVQYCSRFRFFVQHGASFDVVLRGTGTFEEIQRRPLLRVG